MSAIQPTVAPSSEARLDSLNGSADGRGLWFVGYTKPREEARAQENLLRQGFECHLPLTRLQKRTTGVLAWRQEPLFPRYLFLRPGPGSAPMDRVRSTVGMTGLVHFSGLPATIAQTVVDELKALCEDFRQMLFRRGESVKFVEGPLAGLAGIFEHAEGDARAIVLLEFLSREHRVSVSMESIQSIG